MALGVSGRLRPRIFSTFGTTSVVVRQPNAPTAFTPGEIPGTHFQRLSRPQGTWFCRKEPRKKSQVTLPGIDPGTVGLVAQCLNHYATLGCSWSIIKHNKLSISFSILYVLNRKNHVYSLLVSRSVLNQGWSLRCYLVSHFSAGMKDYANMCERPVCRAIWHISTFVFSRPR